MVLVHPMLCSELRVLKRTALPNRSCQTELPNRDLVFERREKYYVADMSDWVTDEDLEEYAASYVVTVEQLGASLTKKQLAGLNAARKFIASAGFPSQLEAIHLLTDENLDVSALGCSVANIQRAGASTMHTRYYWTTSPTCL